jgi:hypothetical protein
MAYIKKLPVYSLCRENTAIHRFPLVGKRTQSWQTGFPHMIRFYLLTSVFVEYDERVEVGGKAL